MKPIAAGSTASEGAPPALISRFAQRVAALMPGGGNLGLAVSGGPDSLGLLLLASRAMPGRVEVATVDHGLRPESAGECALVQEVAGALDVPCTVLRVEVAPGNVQARAREARYAALAGWAIERGLAAIATAHHADDQAETLLMRLNRGSGIAGLAGVRERGVLPGSTMPLLRPLLQFRRRELEQVVRACGIEPARDPSNHDERFDRVRLRKAMAATEALDPAAIAASASHLADAEEALDWAARREWDERVTVAEAGIRYVPQAPRAVVLRVTEWAIAQLGSAPRGGDAARLLERLAAGRPGNVAGVLASVEDGAWLFRPEPPRKTG